jgi:formate dehydrogenase subunit delta
MDVDHLVTMANEIAAFFASSSAPDCAAQDVAGHLQHYWEPRMRAALRGHLAAGGAGLLPVARAAVQLLPQPAAAALRPLAGRP